MSINLKKLHNEILYIINFIDKTCKKNNLKYYLMGGSALGSVRHNGFIPWDDDFDIFMEQDDYYKLISIVKSLNNNEFMICEENTKNNPLFFTKILLNGTEIVENNGAFNNASKIYIDIMCLSNCVRSISYIQYIFGKFLSAYGLYIRGYKSNSYVKKFIILVSGILLRNSFIRNLILEFVRLRFLNKSKYVGHFFGRANFNKSIYERKLIGNKRLNLFENIELPVFEFVEEYLVIRYGKDYSIVPNEKNIKLKYPSHIVCYKTRSEEKIVLSSNE